MQLGGWPHTRTCVGVYHRICQTHQNTGHLDDGDGAVFLVHSVDVGAEVQCLLIVAVADTRLHHLRDFKNFKQLRVP